MKKLITGIEPNSISESLGITPGDFLLSVNGTDIKDVFDYRMAVREESLEIEIEKPDGEQWVFDVEKDEEEDLGLIFDSGLMDDAKSCANRCVFCFIDQLPKNMRQTLYFKDDDWRLSFLSGNYVTLTNMTDRDADRLIGHRLSPVNISVHSVSAEVRSRMLNNKKAGDIMRHIKKLYDAGISMNFQIVLCKGINDGEVLDESIAVLSEYMPVAVSLSVVPAGLTKFREDLIKIEPFDKADAQRVLEQIHRAQRDLKKRRGSRFVYPADEFYLKAGEKIPRCAAYEDFPQIENGVGMIAAFEGEFSRALKKTKPAVINENITVVTGVSSAGFMKGLALRLEERFEGLSIEILEVINDFFGERITVSGLLTGRDIIKALQRQTGQFQNGRVLLPKNALKSDEDTFLDDITLTEMERVTGRLITAVPLDGGAFVDIIVNGGR